MHFLDNHRRWQKITKRLQLLFLMAVATAAGFHSAYAATIYQCKQAGGKVVFQETPCAPSDTQSEVGKTSRTTPSKTAPVNASGASEYAVCRLAGVKVFDPTLSQNMQHPQAAFNLCAKTLSSPMNKNGFCMDACMQAWMDEYQKKYIGKKQ